MNLDMPYYKLGNQERVEYIPLKLALNDTGGVNDHYNNNSNSTFGETEKLMMQQFEEAVDNGNVAANNLSIGIIILISLAAFVVLFLILYVIYYFVILRDRRGYSENVDDTDTFIFQ
jgi:hypothetical protein